MRQRHYEHRLRASVRRERGCLGSLPRATRELLGLRAGLEGAPLSRSDAAARLGISRPAAARLEHSGLRSLHAACGGGASSPSSHGQAPARLIALARGAPALQPAVFLPASNAPSLRPVADISKPRGSGGVKDATASSGSGGATGGRSVLPAEIPTAVPSDDTKWAVLLAVCLAALGGALLIALRRRAVAASGAGAQAAGTPPVSPPPAALPAIATAAATAAPQVATRPAPTPPEPTAAAVAPPIAPAPTPPEPKATAAATPIASPATTSPPRRPVAAPASQVPAPGQQSARLKRSASVVATGLLSVAARELMRRRRRR